MSTTAAPQATPVQASSAEKQEADEATRQRLQKLKEPIHEELMEEVPATHQRVICIALDHSEHADYAFHWALDNIIRKETDQVVLLNVRDVVNVPSSFGLVYMDMGDWIDRTEQEYMLESHRLLKHYGAKVLKAGCRAIALRGDPRDELVYKTKELHADLFIIGSRGMGALKRTFLGSVSDYCVHSCLCPVLVVRHDSNSDKKKEKET
ncbi:hypothetical protein DFS34DRAFT_145600 [Phlyctochytrium arcticum]|nr:hypothetical protein DFS34DRAFT_145600 [Phlyctochytrium arcticum]